MGRKARRIQEPSSDDDAPEVVSQSTSKADAKRSQKALQAFEAEENTRRKARNRERDQKLKERARVTKTGRKKGEKPQGQRPLDEELEGEDEEESGADEGDDDMEARMLRAMRDAGDEVESGEGEEEDGEFKGLVDSDDDMKSGSGTAFVQDEEDEDAEMTQGGSDSDVEEMDEDEEDDETAPPQTNVRRSSRKADYLADDLFAAAFASQNSKLVDKKNADPTKQQIVKKRRRPSIAHAKDLVVGGRTIRTLPSDPWSQATARSLPSARARKFVDRSLAMKGKQALLKAKKRGWERRPANVGVMKGEGAPHGFARTTQ